MRNHFIRFLLCVVGMTSLVSAQVPNKVSYQGLLTKPSGVPVTDGNYTLKIDFYDALSAGTLQQTETFANVNVQLGRFNLTLGSVAPLAAIFTKPLWVQLTATAGPAGITYPQTISPRTELTSSPYSLAPWATNVSSISYTGGWVGIGTANPSTVLDIVNPTGQGTAKIRSGTNSGGLLLLSRYNSPGNYFYLESGAAALDNFAIHHGAAPYADLVVAPTGYIGIGTTSPQSRLHIINPTGSGLPGLQIEQPTGFDWARIRMGVTGSPAWDIAASGGSSQLWFTNGGNANMVINSAGDVQVRGMTTTSTLTITGGSDLSEPFHLTGQDIPKGAIVIIDDKHEGQLKESQQAYDTRVAGILSGARGISPGISMHQRGALEGGKDIALSGRVYALADASNGPIKPGDLLTSSDVAGHCMKATDVSRSRGAIIGKAMSTLMKGRGTVLVLVSLQ